MNETVRTPAHRTRLGAASLALLVATCAAFAALPRLKLLELMELATYDLRLAALHRARGGGPGAGIARAQPRSSRVVLVTLDDDTFAQLGDRAALTRRFLAQVVDQVSAGRPRAIALYLALEGRGDPADDEALGAAIARSGRVLLMRRWVQRGNETFAAPNDPVIARGALGEGSALFAPGPDALVRSVNLLLASKDRRVDSLELLAVQRAWELKTNQLIPPEPGDPTLVLRHDADDAPGPVRVTLDAQNAMLVDLAGPEPPFRTVSFAQLPAALAREPALLADRLVLVGITAGAGHDFRPVPVAPGDQPALPGVQVHAYALANVLSGRTLGRASPTWDALAAFALGLALLLALCSLPPLAGVPVALALFAGYLAYAAYAFLAHGVWLAVTVPCLTSTAVLIEWICLRALESRRVSQRREEALRTYARQTGASLAIMDPAELAVRLTGVRRVLAAPQSIDRLQAMLPKAGEPIPSELAWALALAFLADRQLALALPMVRDLDRASLPLSELYELALALETNGALSDAVRVLERILSRDRTFRDAEERHRSLEARDRQVPERLRQVLSPRYVDLEYIASGGMARVYSAQDTRLGTRVAVKVPDEALMTQADTRKRFMREVKALAALDHPNVVRILDVSTETATAYYTMEFVAGETLRDILTRERTLTEVEAVRVMRPIASVLATLHAKGMIHRDIKPENILIDGAGRPRLTDFGVAHMEDQTRMTRTSVSVGTPAYMAPEQLEGERPSPRVDVYAFGLVLFEALVGTNPYLAGAASTKLAKEVPRARSLAPHVSADLDALIASCVARVPAYRPIDGAELENALSAVRC